MLNLLINLVNSLHICSYNLYLCYILIIDSHDQSVPLPLLFRPLMHLYILPYTGLPRYHRITLFNIMYDCKSVFLMIHHIQVVKQLLV